MKLFNNIYLGKRVLITGHTGFKGSWLALWLHELGAEVFGLAFPPETHPNHWSLLHLPVNEYFIDIRDKEAVERVFQEVEPEIIFHLAAQPLVRRSYYSPLETWSTNVMGTVHILEACREQDSVRAIVSVTTDKCYENQEWLWGYRENDPLGGYDPYSASKAGSELVAASYRSSFFTSNSAPLLATARAGNVIGGGDWSEDRLLPDLVRALQKGRSLEIRSPESTRPWQHVLESLSGYLLLGQHLYSGDARFAEAWNFGPERESNRTVSDVLIGLNKIWSNVNWHVTMEPQLHESSLLYLDSGKARAKLHWEPVWNFETTLEKTANWYFNWVELKKIISHYQLISYIEDAVEKNIGWAN